MMSPILIEQGLTETYKDVEVGEIGGIFYVKCVLIVQFEVPYQREMY